MSSEISEMSEARRRAEARKQKILAKGAERIAAAKGEGVTITSQYTSRDLSDISRVYQRTLIKTDQLRQERQRRWVSAMWQCRVCRHNQM